MNEEKRKLIDAYKLLSIDQMRNEYSNELIIIGSILNKYLEAFGEIDLEYPTDYKSKVEAGLTEEDMLIRNYTDILEIKNNLLLLLAYFKKMDNI